MIRNLPESEKVRECADNIEIIVRELELHDPNDDYKNKSSETLIKIEVERLREICDEIEKEYTPKTPER